MTTFTINGKSVDVTAEADTPLLWVIREHLKLTGTKFGCGIAQCGACTVHIDGEPTRSCSVQLSSVSGKTITTNGVSLVAAVTFDGVGGGWTLGGGLTTNKAVTLTNGALSVSTYTFTCLTFASSNSNTRSLTFGSGGSFSITGNNTTVLDMSTATNLTFTVDSGQVDAVADRHNHPLPIPVAFHHIHLYTPQGADVTAKAWYAQTFGGVPGKRSNYQAVDLPGINLNFSRQARAQAPTKGRMLGHIGFEIRNLEAFCKTLEGRGVKLDVPYAKGSNGVATAWLTDPWGTSIELTEGLNRL